MIGKPVSRFMLRRGVLTRHELMHENAFALRARDRARRIDVDSLDFLKDVVLSHTAKPSNDVGIAGPRVVVENAAQSVFM